MISKDRPINRIIEQMHRSIRICMERQTGMIPGVLKVSVSQRPLKYKRIGRNHPLLLAGGSFEFLLSLLAHLLAQPTKIPSPLELVLPIVILPASDVSSCSAAILGALVNGNASSGCKVDGSNSHGFVGHWLCSC